MAVSARPENFFQTTSSIAEIERKNRKSTNTQGNPIRLSSKILAVEVNRNYDPTGDVVFVAEAGGIVSGIKLSTNEVSRVGKGSTAPLTSLTHYASQSVQASADGTAQTLPQMNIFAGGWNKTITNYAFASNPASNTLSANPYGTVTAQTEFKAHNDFVKCLLVAITADTQPILVSGGADGEINFWNPATNTRLATVKPQARGIECLALDPYSNPAAPILFFSTSQREIFSIQIPILSQISSPTMQAALSSPLVVHETSVYKLHFDNITGDLWTASADKTAKRLAREESWKPDTTLIHPDFVRDVITHPRLPYVITACRDEEIRIWNSNTSDLYHIFTGHFEEVTGLAIASNINNVNNNSNINNDDLLISISIDSTLRRWSLNQTELSKEIQKSKNPSQEGNKLLDELPEPSNKGVIAEMGLELTEEEEAELNALMEEEESESLEKMVGDMK